MITRNHSDGNGERDPLQFGPTSEAVTSENLIRIVWRGRWLILLVTVIAVVAAIVYLVKATPVYTSTSRIYVEQSGPKIFSEAETSVMTQSKNYLHTQVELLKSTPIIAAVLEDPGIGHMITLAAVDNSIAYLKKKLDVRVGKKDDIISVSFNSPYPAEAAQLVNEVVDSYITYHATRKRSTSAEVLKILQSEKARRSKELTDKLTAMLNFKKENESLALEGSRGNIVITRLERLSQELTEAQLATIQAKSDFEAIEEMVSDPGKVKQFIEARQAGDIRLSADNAKAVLRSKLDQLDRRRADRRRQLKSGHPAVMALETEIAHVEQQIADLDAEFARARLAVAEQQYTSAKQREDQIARYYDEQRKQALDLNEQLAQYTILQSDWEQTRRLCEILDERIKELNVTEDVGALNISVLEVARAADKPSEPQRATCMAKALMAGFMLGVGLTLIRDWRDHRLRSAEDISAVLDLPILGVVPSMSRRLSIVDRGQKVNKDSDSPVAEAYRTIRTAVFFGAREDEARTILVTSPAPADGKTTLVSNLAIAMAQAGQKTLILDGDFRKPMQHRIFELNNRDVGLSSVLAGAMTLDEVIRPTGIRGLELLSCGLSLSNPSEALNSKRFADALEILSDRYDRIIVDAPPVMPVTDAQILAAICDVTLLVLRAEKSTRKTSQQARDGLLSVGANILGALVNDVPKKGSYGYYSSYGYKYGNGGGRNNKKGADNGEPELAIGGHGRFGRSNG
ncbi:MAG: GumC family protein [Planctomycetota bacterium]